MIHDFKAAHRKSWYMSEESYLDAVYRKNKELIDKSYKKAFEKAGTDIKVLKSFKKYFKSEVRRLQETNSITLKKAVKLYANYPIFKSKGEVGIDNFLSGLKKNPDAWNQFRNLNRDEKGRYLPFDPDKLKWINGKEVIYDNRIIVSFLDSPVAVVITDLRDTTEPKTIPLSYGD